MKLIKIEVTIQEIWGQTRPSVERNKKKYYRKRKHKKHDDGTRSEDKSYSYRGPKQRH